MLLTQTLKADNDTRGVSSSLVSYSDELPAWFFDGGIIGISDPSYDSVQAYNQAVLRALSFYAFNQSAEISSVYEYYYLDDNVNTATKNQKSHWIAEFHLRQENLSYRVEKIFQTKYNETIVLLDVCRDTLSNDELIVDGSFMYHYDYYNNKTIYGEKQMITTSLSSMPDTLKWKSTIDGNVINKMSIVGDNTKKLNNISMVYNDFGQIVDDMTFTENRYGLWDCCIDTFFQSLSNFESDNIIVKNTSRYISQENNGIFEDRLQNIVRSVMKINISCKLTALSFNNNNLFAKWEISE